MAHNVYQLCAYRNYCRSCVLEMYFLKYFLLLTVRLLDDDISIVFMATSKYNLPK